MEQPSNAEPQEAGNAKEERPRWQYLLIGALLVALVGGGYWVKTRPGTDAGGSQEALIKDGLDALYTRNDPNGAAVQFRKVLAQNPSHYGATYQLATALDRAGKPDEARQYWEKMLPMAEAVRDEQTAAAARGRLAKQPKPATDEATLMQIGLDALHTRNDPTAAAAEFRKVLQRNPTHYGATYQLATALDRAGKPAEARPLWETVLKMAEGYNDQPTVATARARLARNP